MLWFVGSAFGSSVAGFGVPVVGGGFAAPAQPGALGLLGSPTAAVRGSSPELAVDLGFNQLRLEMRLDDWDQSTLEVEPSLQPTAMAVIPLGRFGFGATLQAPYARGTIGDPRGPQRLYTTASNLRVLEEDLVAAALPVDWFAVGAGVRFGEFQYLSAKAIDTGVLLDTSLAPDPPLPVGDPFLEGTQTVDQVSDLLVSWVAGMSLGTRAGPTAVLTFTPAWTTHGDGQIGIVPSNDLAASIDGGIQVQLTLPATLLAAGRIPIGRWTVEPAAQWVGWSRTGHTVAEVHDLALTSEDPALDGLLASSGLDRASFLDSLGGRKEADLGWHDVVNVEILGSFRPVDPVELRAGVGYAPSAVPSAVVHPANLDFARVDLRVGAAWQALPPLRIAASFDDLAGATRAVTDSKYDQTDPPDPGAALPSANGKYALSLWRAGLTVILSVPPRGAAR